MILRNFVLLLLFTNALLIAWQLWIVPADHPDPYDYADASIPQLEIWAEGEVANEVVADNRTSTLELGDPGQLTELVASEATPEYCLRVGPFAELGLANQVREQLLDQASEISRISEPGEAWVGHWVQIIGLENREEAETAVAELVKAGIADAYIVQFTPTLDISLGVYRSLDSANDVIGMASGRGYEAVMEDRVRPTVEHWLVARLGADKTLELDGINLAAGQILRSEQVACEVSELENNGEAG